MKTLAAVLLAASVLVITGCGDGSTLLGPTQLPTVQAPTEPQPVSTVAILD